MANTRSLETARVEFRMSADLKSEVEEAAALLGATFTSFATEILIERARQVKRDYSLTILNDTERDAFLEMLANPPSPSESLVKLMNTEVNLPSGKSRRRVVDKDARQKIVRLR